MNRKIAVLILIILFANLYSCGSRQSIQTDEEENTPQVEAELPEPTRAELVMRAVFDAYNEHLEKIEFRSGDWAVLLRGTWFYYAGGRMLPEEELENESNYRSLQFYGYPADLPEWVKPADEETERYRNWTTMRSQTQIRRSNFFLDALWQAGTRTQTENNMVRITFLGKRAKIHKDIQDILARIETRILAIAVTESEVQTWINSINTLEGYGWRNIADTQSRSYHSYGLAVDLLPRSMGSKQTYWLWTSHYREDWWNVSYKERYHPPLSVIKIFESHGFVWGGKWPLFDTMHFEYRPEILILNGLLNTQ